MQKAEEAEEAEKTEEAGEAGEAGETAATGEAGETGGAPRAEGGREPVGAGAVRPRRRRGRTALLIATAAVLGVVAGTCTGYLVQADREPAALPPLSQPVLPRAEGPAPEPLTAAQDHRVKTEGDLRKLLLPKPRGAREAEWLKGDDGWLDLARYAGYFEKPGDAFDWLVREEYRRGAATAWEGDTSTVDIRLLQYRQVDTMGAADVTRSNQEYRRGKDGVRSWPIPGAGESMAYVLPRADAGHGRARNYGAEAFAWRGDLALEIFIDSDKPVSKAQIIDLAQRQLERL
ncbi:hypothetical protein [Streptomyces sp. NPDC018610]|uniref:hypothetical protein n=1 Tax=Streptomyces sp. NPDC018610 TaxID=3365049 RepID=UPI00379AE981